MMMHRHESENLFAHSQTLSTAVPAGCQDDTSGPPDGSPGIRAQVY